MDTADVMQIMQDDAERNSMLYKSIQTASLQEQADSNGNTLQQHCSGVMAAIKAVYQLGYSQGFTAGAEYAEKQIMGN